MLQFLAQRPEDLVPRVGAVVVLQLLERVGLRGFEKGPEVVFGDAMLGVRDVGLLQHAILVLADEEIRDVLLKGEFRGFLPRHALVRLNHRAACRTPEPVLEKFLKAKARILAKIRARGKL